jgi:GNAT superfamily N-acetyltransferase
MSEAPVRIDPATPADLPEILELIAALADFERLRHLCVATPAQMHDALFGPRPAAEVLIARGPAGGPAAGFALYCQTFSTFLGMRTLWLEDLFVRPGQRGRGIGRALLTALARVARTRGCGRFEWAVLDWNTRAIEFYEAQGAKVMADWRICRVTGEALERLAGPAQG